MNRKEKIELLKGIANGTTSVNDAIELQDITKAELWVSIYGSNTYKNQVTGEVLTEQEYKARNKNSLTITFS
jgi:hypothetical protein